MMLLAHIFIAVASMILAFYTLFSPSKTKLQVSCGLVTLTISSGTYLVVTMETALIKACLTGLAYLAITFGAMILAHNRLKSASQTISTKQ